MHVESLLTKLANNILRKVYSLDLNCVIKLKVQGRTHSGKRSLYVDRKVKLIGKTS